jgi:copper chaperone NosL
MTSHVRNGFAPWAGKIGITLFLVLVVAFPALLHSQPAPVPQGTKCVECGMMVDKNSKYMSEVITYDNKILFFCEVGDMLLHFKTKRQKIREVYVRNHDTGEWIDGTKAFYVWNKKLKTPMSWNIVAFAAESAARKWGDPADFNGAFTLLR